MLFSRSARYSSALTSSEEGGVLLMGQVPRSCSADCLSLVALPVLSSQRNASHHELPKPSLDVWPDRSQALAGLPPSTWLLPYVLGSISLSPVSPSPSLFSCLSVCTPACPADPPARWESSMETIG